jgi:ParB family chromosome partitioning protein
MHPADEFEAMHELVVRGKTVEDVAAAFGVLPIVVKRRLRLANIAPSIFQLYRDDEANLAQLEALALTDDHTKQEHVWQALPEYQRQPHRIRDLLTSESVSTKEDRVAKYVGVAAYEKAGGVVTKDLFSDNDAGYMADVPLLEKLAMDKLTKYSKKLAQEGYAWVDINLRASYSEVNAYGKPRKIIRAATDEELLIHAQLEKDQQQLEDDGEKLQANADTTDEEIDAISDRETALEKRWQAYEALLESPHADDAAITGALLTLDASGKIFVHRNLIRPSDKKQIVQAAKAEANQGDSAEDEKQRPAHSEKLTRHLTAMRTAALQAELMQRPDVALVALTYRLAKRAFYQYNYSDSIVKVSTEFVPLTTNAPDVEQSKAWEAIEAKRNELKRLLPADDDKDTLLAWMLDQEQKVILDLMAFCIATAVNTIQFNDNTNPEFEQIGAAVDLNMSNWWTPTQQSYFNHVSKQRIVDVVTEAVSLNDALPFAAMKKTIAAEAAERAVAGCNWLPPMMKLHSATAGAAM